MEKCSAFMLHLNLSLKGIILYSYLQENLDFAKLIFCIAVKDKKSKSNGKILWIETISLVAFYQKTSQLCEMFGIFSQM